MTNQNDSIITQLAHTAYNSFERKTRTNGEVFYACKDDAPSWIREAVHDAHGDQFPSDEIYEFCHSVFGTFADYECADEDGLQDTISQIEPDVYNRDLFNWLGDNLNNQYYVDQVMQEFGLFKTIVDAIGAGQVLHRQEIAQCLAQALIKQAEEVA